MAATAAARSQHAGGVTAVMVDGSTHFITNDVDPNVWWAYGTRNAAQATASGIKESPPTPPN